MCRMSREALIQFEGHARQKIVASVIWDRTIRRSRFTPNRNTASSSGANIDKMNLDAKSWVVGKDYSAAPTCATCHLSATPTQPVTHDVGDRITYTLRPAISIKQQHWEKKRAWM